MTRKKKTKARAQKPRRRPRKKKTAGARLRATGAYLGNALGGDVGRVLGHGAADVISKIFGLGDYTVAKNTLIHSGGGPPSFSNNSDGSIDICHREYVGEVVGSTSYSVTKYAIQPGNDTLFPWLSTLAANFEQWEPMGIIVEYRPTSGTAVSSTSSALGKIVIATNYDVLDADYVDFRSMEQSQYVVSTVPFNSVIHPIECKPSEGVLHNLYLRHHDVTYENTDMRFHDLGNLYVAAGGMQSAYVTGELWISYHVRLRKPKIPSVPGILGKGSEIIGSQTSSGVVDIFSNVSIRSGSTLDVSYSTSSMNFLIPTGSLILFVFECDATTLTSPPGFSTSNLSAEVAFFHNASNVITLAQGSQYLRAYLWTTTSASPLIVCSSAPVFTGTLEWTIHVVELPSTLYPALAQLGGVKMIAGKEENPITETIYIERKQN